MKHFLGENAQGRVPFWKVEHSNTVMTETYVSFLLILGPNTSFCGAEIWSYANAVCIEPTPLPPAADVLHGYPANIPVNLSQFVHFIYCRVPDFLTRNWHAKNGSATCKGSLYHFSLICLRTFWLKNLMWRCGGVAVIMSVFDW
jgi:hypothetical protein